MELCGRVDAAPQPLQDLRTIARGRPNSEAFLSWADGTVVADPVTRIERLQKAIEEFERIGRVIDEARCRMALADALESSGHDPVAERTQAGKLLNARGIHA
jgi:hypothetical protein